MSSLRMRKDQIPLTFEEHKKIAEALLAFLSSFEEVFILAEKGFSKNSSVIKKLSVMKELGDFLRYSLQQGADLHRSRLGIKPADEEYAKWTKLYLRD